jgi:hypothetical protein
MNHGPSWLLCLLGFSLLALAVERQQEEIFGRALSAPATRWLRAAGWVALALALVESVQEQGWALGLVTYSGLTSLSAGLVFVALVVRARFGRR